MARKRMGTPKIIKGSGKLHLTTKGGLNVFWLGTGSAFTKKMYQTNFLLIKGDSHILVDCGTRCSTALYDFGKTLMDIKTYLITHSHADHIGGLEEAALMNRYVSRVKPNIILTREYEDILWHFSLKGGCAFGERCDGDYLAFEDFFVSHYPKQIVTTPREIYEIDYEGFNIKLFRTMHYPDCAKGWMDSFFSVGVLVDNRVMFTSDTRFDKKLIFEMLELYPEIQTIFHDVQFFSGGVHASYDELKDLPADIKKMIYLVHYGDNYEKFDPQKDGFAGFTLQSHYYSFD